MHVSAIRLTVFNEDLKIFLSLSLNLESAPCERNAAMAPEFGMKSAGLLIISRK
jgi:hypothetical protein